jgi:hypothetical protein
MVRDVGEAVAAAESKMVYWQNIFNNRDEARLAAQPTIKDTILKYLVHSVNVPLSVRGAFLDKWCKANVITMDNFIDLSTLCAASPVAAPAASSCATQIVVPMAAFDTSVAASSSGAILEIPPSKRQVTFRNP